VAKPSPVGMSAMLGMPAWSDPVAAVVAPWFPGMPAESVEPPQAVTTRPAMAVREMATRVRRE
jgi:hypothetical protein